MFILGLSIGFLVFPLGFALGFNVGASVDVKRIKKIMILRGVIK